MARGGADFHGPTVRAARLGTPRVPLVAREALKAKAVEARAARPSSLSSTARPLPSNAD